MLTLFWAFKKKKKITSSLTRAGLALELRFFFIDNQQKDLRKILQKMDFGEQRHRPVTETPVKTRKSNGHG